MIETSITNQPICRDYLGGEAMHQPAVTPREVFVAKLLFALVFLPVIYEVVRTLYVLLFL